MITYKGNAAKRQSEKGDHSAFTDEFRKRHTASFRLSDLGRQQALAAGEWIRNEFYEKGGIGFDRYVTSEYYRAMETAALLNLPKADWLCDFYLSERSWGDIDVYPENERVEKFGQALQRREVEAFFWAPPNGESFTQLCQRVDRALDTLHRGSSDKRVIIVCHGEVMWAFRVRIERMSQEKFKELNLSDDPNDRIHNCQILHYTRRDPNEHKLTEHANWMRMIRPQSPGWRGE